jgi:hypothetical protein
MGKAYGMAVSFAVMQLNWVRYSHCRWERQWRRGGSLTGERSGVRVALIDQMTSLVGQLNSSALPG